MRSSSGYEPPVRVTRVHVDGPFGIGKSSTLAAMAKTCSSSLSESKPELLITPEPMKYWRDFFVDLVAAVGTASEFGRGGHAGCEDVANEAFSSLQMKFADPYLLLHDRLARAYGPCSSVFGNPDLLLCFDRHSLASTACFPAARFLNGNCEADCLLSLLIKTPTEPPGCNLVIADLASEQEHVRRLTSRGRAGEDMDVGLLRALRASYGMLIATIDYAKSKQHRGGMDGIRIADVEWDSVPMFTSKRRDEILETVNPAARISDPSLGDTLLSLLKNPSMCHPGTENLRTVHKWAAESFLEKIKGIHTAVLQLDGKTPDECAAEVFTDVREMLTTMCKNAFTASVMKSDIKDYSLEVGYDRIDC